MNFGSAGVMYDKCVMHGEQVLLDRKSDTGAKSRMTIYVSDENRRRLSRVPRGRKTDVINDALGRALDALEKSENFDGFLASVRAIKPARATKSSVDMTQELRATGTIAAGRKGR